MTHDTSSNWNLTLTVGGLGITLAGLYLLRRSRTRKWIDLGRMPHLTSRTLQGQTIVITGANTGLGFDAATEISRRGAPTVILACRDLNRGSEAARRIRDLTGNPNVECLKLNLASLQSVHEFAAEFNKKFETLDILICNAGVWIPMDRGEKTDDGFEIHFGVNHLSHFLLTNLLQDKLKSSQAGGKGRKPDVDSGKKNRSFAPTGYSDTKMMNGLFAKSLATKFPDSIEAYAVCPGWCKTDLARYLHISFLRKVLMTPIAFLFMRSSAQGSHNIVYLCLEDKSKLLNGGFYRDGKVEQKENTKLDSMSDVGEKLWTLSEKLCQLK